ncbi:MAG TPA: beta/gamma crystallin-related protein [Caldimonas sp.]|nr:beta/gamma crystallin-related protein [Caldimonas sp.]
MNKTLRPLLGIAAVAFAAHASAQITFYEGEGFRGRTFQTNGEVGNFARVGFNDRASSVVVDRGRWEVCEDARFQGRCVVLRRGSYDTLSGMGMENRISSVRRVDDRRQYDNEVPYSLAEPNYEHRRIPNERLREVPITSARAVMGPPEQRCWVEPGQVSERRDLNVPGAIIGGVLGGILGHQVGGGTGNTVATIGGAVGGSALGANIDRIRDPQSGKEVRRCENVAGQTPQYWDVTYNYGGVQHRVQMSTPPGQTITVNDRGEPRL